MREKLRILECIFDSLDEQNFSVVFLQLALDHDVVVGVHAGSRHVTRILVHRRHLLFDDRRQGDGVVRVEVFLLNRADREDLGCNVLSGTDPTLSGPLCGRTDVVDVATDVSFKYQASVSFAYAEKRFKRTYYPENKTVSLFRIMRSLMDTPKTGTGNSLL